MDSFYLQPDVPGVLTERLVTAQAASILTGYNIQHIRRLAFNGKLEAIRVGRSWLVRFMLSLFSNYLLIRRGQTTASGSE